ncbi:sulfhydryl oxidase 2 [Clupea harengus]|uniref:Sulfhydryl oxidase n=1 Tax=Clupea harengus TaxID=7950 RepID=A0A6P8FB92_CLUHA|nr:sulfhydryl oxidase 2 [Clupea harengus]
MAVVYSDDRASQQMAVVVSLRITLCLFVFLLSAPSHAARLYTEDDPVTILTSDTLKQSVQNSTTAWLVQFYSSWCGHCIQYSPTWKALAGDVKDWDHAMRIGVLDCAHEKNFDVCKDFEIHFYPTFRYFKAHGSTSDVGKTYRGPDRELQTVRQLMVNFLQNHTTQDWPSRCPPLEPSRSEDILDLLGQKSEQYTAVIIEDADSYVGREVILDLMPYEGVSVRRALSSDKLLMDRLGVTAVPATYLLHPNGTHGLMDAQKRLRFFFSSFLKLLPGVHRLNSASLQNPAHSSKNGHKLTEEWRQFEKSKVYMADLESGLHYLLRVELATHQSLEGEELRAFKDFVTVVAKLFPGRSSVVKLLETLLEWIVSLPLEKIPYDAVLDLVNNKMRISGLFLSERVQWVGCQGSSVALRGYPCSLWTLFHVLTVQAAQRPDALANTGTHTWLTHAQRPDALANTGTHTWLTHAQRPDALANTGTHTWLTHAQRPDALANTGTHTWLTHAQRPDALANTGTHTWLTHAQRPDALANTGTHTWLTHAQRPDALANTAFEEDPQAVLQTMRRYISTFFGCQECGRHFEEMAKESMGSIKSADEAVLWLWRKHNQVNSRLAGSMSEDPLFPKTQWPTPDLCPLCHEERSGLHVWNEPTVLSFLKRHYGTGNISPKYALDPPRPPRPSTPEPVERREPERASSPATCPAPAPATCPAPAPAPGPATCPGPGPAPCPATCPGPAPAPAPGPGVEAHREPGMNFLALGFSSVDMSLCVLLYAFSCVFLMLMFFFFRARSRRWKVRANRPFV